MAFLSNYVKLIAFFHPPNRAAHSFIRKDKIQNQHKKYQIQSPRISQGLLYNFRRLLNQSRCESLKRDGRTEVFIAALYNGTARQWTFRGNFKSILLNVQSEFQKSISKAQNHPCKIQNIHIKGTKCRAKIASRLRAYPRWWRQCYWNWMKHEESDLSSETMKKWWKYKDCLKHETDKSMLMSRYGGAD